MLKLQENLLYVSLVTEILNIIYMLTASGSRGAIPNFSIVLLVFNSIYVAYLLFVLVFTRGNFRRLSYVVLTLSFLNSVIWADTLSLSILTSIVSMGFLIYYHRFIYFVFDEVKNMESKKTP